MGSAEACSDEDRPVIFVIDEARDVTGALMAARRQAQLLSDVARFVLVLPNDSRLDHADLPEFESVLHLPIVGLRRSARALARYLPLLLSCGRQLAIHMRRHGCTRLQVNDFMLAQGAAARLFGFRGTIITWVRMDPARQRIYAPLLRLAQATSDYLVAVSGFIRSRLPDGLRARLLYEPAPALLPTADCRLPLRLVFVGNYIEGKGQDLAIRAFAKVAPDFPEAELVFHGSDMGLEKNRAYRCRLTQIAKDAGLDTRIIVADFLSEPGVALDEALVGLNLSRNESFSLTTQEASARGVAVIATRSGGPEEIVEHGVTGWLVPVDDVDAAADAMRAALERPAATMAMGRRGAELMRSRFPAEPFRMALIEMFGLSSRSAAAIPDSRSEARE